MMAEPVPAGSTPDRLSTDVATLLWPTASLLALWDRLDVEIGDVAVVTDGHPWSPLAAVVASWYGAFPILFVSEGVDRTRRGQPSDRGSVGGGAGPAGSAAGPRRCGGSRPQRTRRLRRPAARVSSPAVRPDASPATPARALTIDFYVNVHRKGLHMVSRLLTAASTAGTPGGPAGVSEAHVARARLLLADPERMTAARTAVHPPGVAWSTS